MPEIYVGVGSITAPHSNVWKMWTQGDEFYATQLLGMGQIAKVSVHSSGICRFASVPGADLAWDRDDDPRVLQRWRIAPVGTDPWSHCFLLVVPAVYIPDRTDLTGKLKERHANRTVWVDPPDLGWATQIEFLRAEDPAASLEDQVQDCDRVLGRLALRSGAVVWVLVRLVPLSAKDSRAWQTRVAEAIFTLEYDELKHPEGSDAHATLTSPSDFPVPTVRDIALGNSNFRVNSSQPRSRRIRRAQRRI